MDFEWDEAKSNRNRLDRGFGFDLASLIFAGPVLEVEDGRYDYGERRMRAIGQVEGLTLFVVYTDRGDVRRIISARPAKQKERQVWRLFVEAWNR
jgi:uncharacterized DUF497 family protein